MVQGKINRGRHTDHPDGRQSIRTKQCPPPTIPHSLMEWLATGKIRPLVVTDYRQLREPGDLQLWIK